MNELTLTELLPRVLGSMALVIIVMAVAARLLKGRQIPGAGGMRLNVAAKRENPIEVIARQGVGRHAALTVVRAGDKTLLLGVTEQNVSVLTQLEDSVGAEVQLPDIQGTDITVDDVLNASPGQSWTGLLSQVRERTVRRT